MFAIRGLKPPSKRQRSDHTRASHGAGRPGDIPYGVVDEARSADSHHEWLAGFIRPVPYVIENRVTAFTPTWISPNSAIFLVPHRQFLLSMSDILSRVQFLSPKNCGWALIFPLKERLMGIVADVSSIGMKESCKGKTQKNLPPNFS